MSDICTFVHFNIVIIIVDYKLLFLLTILLYAISKQNKNLNNTLQSQKYEIKK